MQVYNEENKIEIEVYDSLKRVMDPELGINIVDLGLIYKITYTTENGIHITMTLSTKGCPMSDVIMDQMDSVLSETFPDKKHHIELVWEPVWNTSFVTPEGKKSLGLTF